MTEMGDARVRRSLFFVPGGEPRKLEKCRSMGADTVMLDLEDSVPVAEKDRARALVAETLSQGGFGEAEPGVRVNPPSTPYFADDLEAVVSAGAQAIMLPKSESAEDLAEVARRIGQLEGSGGAGARPVQLLALVETAVGVADVRSVATATPRLTGLCLGHADFSRDMGLTTIDPASGVVLHARCQLAIAAKAAGVTPIDTVCLDVRDEAAFRRDTELGVSLGFEGRLCIHPMQVAIANEIFSPTQEQIEYAKRVVDGAREAKAEGRGVFTVDGKMVDAPLVAVQERLLDKARRIGMLAG